METVTVIPKIDTELNRVELFFMTEIYWSCTCIPYLRIACWCEAEGHNECCLEAMRTNYHPPETLIENVMVETALRRYRDLHLEMHDQLIVRKRLSKQEINRAR